MKDKLNYIAKKYETVERLLEGMEEGDRKVVEQNVALGIEHLEVAIEYLLYYSRPIVKVGELNVQGDRFCLDELILEDGDELEFWDGTEWVRTDVVKYDGEYYLNCERLSVKKDKIQGRIREKVKNGSK